MEPYRDTHEHVLDELRRLDLVLRLRLEEWWAENDGTVDEFRGLYVSDETVDGLLRSTFGDGNRATSTGSGTGSGGTPELLDRIERVAEEIRTRERRTTAVGRELRLVRLAERFDLGPLHRDALVLALAPELDRKYETIYSYLQDDVTRTRPTVDFLLGILGRSERERLEIRVLFSRRSPLLRNRLVRLSPEEGTPRPSRKVTVDERVVEFLLGGDEIAEELASLTELKPPTGAIDDLVVGAIQAEQLDALYGTARDDEESRPLMAYFHGPYGSGKEAAVMAICFESGTAILKVDSGELVQRDLRETLRLLEREARLQDAVLYVEGITPPPDEAKEEIELETVVAHLDAFDGPVFLSGTDPLSARLQLEARRHEFATIHFPVPSYELRKELWDSVDGLPEDVDRSALAAKFRFTRGQIEDAVATAHLLAVGEGLSVDALYRGCRSQANETLGSLARQIEPHYTWDDIVLPADRLAHLHEVAARIRHQGTVYSDWGFAGKFTLGNGLNVLFTGPSGTGKTMAAEIIARDAGLDLYKIDLSSVVSKYIGETEKNLRRIFDEAEETDAILFFDEADALFGKRSEVKDSHDRYANIEVNYLLQRVEEHDGTVILTTNFKQNIDDAFLRRIHLSVDFPRPDQESRAAIWRIIFPESTPVDELDVEFLSSLEMTGGNIKNVALTAAFMAAEDDSDVGMAHIVRAVRREFQKTGKLIRPEEFGRYRNVLT